MITEWYSKKSRFYNQRVRAKTLLFDKYYYWLEDIDGTWYLLPEVDGAPSFA